MGWRRTLLPFADSDQDHTVSHASVPSAVAGALKNITSKADSSPLPPCVSTAAEKVVQGLASSNPSSLQPPPGAQKQGSQQSHVASPSQSIFTPDELARHSSKSDGSIWIAIGSDVYDVTSFMHIDHPGGADVIEAFAGKQCDWQFEYFHSYAHLLQWKEQLWIGTISPAPANPFPRRAKELKADWRVE